MTSRTVTPTSWPTSSAERSTCCETHGAFGLIATNTIAQGDTGPQVFAGSARIDGTIYSARRRYKWPGQAAVIVSIVHGAKGASHDPCELDGKTVPLITAYLFHAGGHEDPQRLRANAVKCFTGTRTLGQGFIFDDEASNGTASSLADMNQLIAAISRIESESFPTSVARRSTTVQLIRLIGTLSTSGN